MEQTAGFLSGKFWWSFAVDDSTMTILVHQVKGLMVKKHFSMVLCKIQVGISHRNNGLYNNNDSNAFYLVFIKQIMIIQFILCDNKHFKQLLVMLI